MTEEIWHDIIIHVMVICKINNCSMIGVVFRYRRWGHCSMYLSMTLKMYGMGFIFLVSAFPVAAQESPSLTPEQQTQYDALIEEAVEHYRAEKYEEAVECFKKANAIQEEPELLFNIARSHEKMLHRKKAIEWYERFLEAPGTLRELRKRALDSIAVLHQEIADEEAIEKSEETAAEQASPPPQTASETDTVTRPTDTATSSSDTDLRFSGEAASPEATSSDEKSRPAPSRLRIASYSLLGVGSVALIVGGVFGGLSLGARSDFESAGYDPIRVQYREDMERNALIFDVAFFSGVALVVVGASLLVVDVVKQKSSHEAALGHRRVLQEKPKARAVKIAPRFMVGHGGLTGGLVGHF